MLKVGLIPFEGAIMFLQREGCWTLLICLIVAASTTSRDAVGDTVDFPVGSIEGEVTWNGGPTIGLGAGNIFALVPGIAGTYLNGNDGTFTFQNLVTGDHTIELYGNGCSQAAHKLGETPVTVTAGTTTTADIDITATAGRITGTITVNSVPLVNPHITIPGLCGEWGSNSAGQVSQYLPPETYTADVAGSSGYIGSFAFEIVAGQTTEVGASIGNTPTGTNVTVTAENPDGTPSPVSLTFDEVMKAGTTTVSSSNTGPPAPSDFELGNPPTYFNINTTAEFTGSVEVCFDYSGVTFHNESKLKLFHFVNGWMDITTSLDTDNDVICGSAASLSFFAAFEPDVFEVAIDIKPRSFPNRINPKSTELIPVAILTTPDFDAASVDALSVGFGPASAPEAHGKSHIQDVDGDGDLDLLLHFKANATGIQCGDTSASLEGQTFDGQPIRGVDSIKTVRCGA